MKVVAKIVFKVHRLIFKYPTRSEIRLVLQDDNYNIGIGWYVGMLYICGESVQQICECMGMTEVEVKRYLIEIAKGVKL